MVKVSGFSPERVAEGELPCGDCGLPVWGSHPTLDRPWCAEQFTFPLLYVKKGEDDVWDVGGPAVISFQKTQLRPSKKYVSNFATKRIPLYSAVTRITLEVNKRGSTIFSVPKFELIDETSQEDWPTFSARYKKIREFLQTPRRRFEDDVVPDTPIPPAVDENKAPVVVATDVDDEEDPF